MGYIIIDTTNDNYVQYEKVEECDRGDGTKYTSRTYEDVHPSMKEVTAGIKELIDENGEFEGDRYRVFKIEKEYEVVNNVQLLLKSGKP